MNKTAQTAFENAETLIFFAVVMFVVTILVFTVVFLVNSYESGLTAVPGRVKAELISLRFVNNPGCFAYQEPTSLRVFTGVIDLSKFNDPQMARCYNTDKKTGKDELNFRLQLGSNKDYSVKTNNYFNVDTFTIVSEVVVKDNLEFKNDTLFIYVQDGLLS